MDALEKMVGDSGALVLNLVKGLDEVVKPRLDAHEKALNDLPDQLKDSFKVFGDRMQAYIDAKVVPGAAPAQAGQAQPGAKPGGLMGRLMDSLDKEIEKAGGIGNLMRGGASGGSNVDAEIATLEKELVNRYRMEVRNVLRKSLNLPVVPIDQVATGTHAGSVTAP
jgi:hypothetical protein